MSFKSAAKNFFSIKGQENGIQRAIQGLQGTQGSSTNTNLAGAVKNYFTPQSVYASEGDPGMVQTGANYSLRAKLNANGSIGYDYFANGQPITAQQYANAGLDIAGDQKKAYADLASQGGGVTNDAFNNGSGRGSGRGSASTTAQWVVGPNGEQYNITDPTQFRAYTDVKNAYIDTEADKGLSDAMLKINRSKEDLNTTRSNLEKSKKKMFGDTTTGDLGTYQEDLNTLGDTRDQNQQGVMGKFLNLGQNVYQSAEGENLDKVKSIYDQGVVDANTEAKDATDNFNNTQRDIDRTAADLVNSEADTNNYYSNWRNTNKAQNTVDFKNAQSQIAAKNASIASNTPTFQEKTFNFLNNAVNAFNSAVPKNVYNTTVAQNLAKSSGVILSTGSNLYKDAQILANADSSDASKTAVENVYKKYGLLN